MSEIGTDTVGRGAGGALACVEQNATGARATGTKARKPAPTVKRKPAATRKPTRRGKARKRAAVRWSAKREELFLSTLAETAKVAAAIAASGFSETSVYRRRKQDAEFRAKWLAALREGYVKLESMMLDRALNGVEKAVWYGGEQVGTMTEYNDRAALALLTLHRGTVMGTSEMAADVPEEELRARLKEKLGEMNKRMGGKG